MPAPVLPSSEDSPPLLDAVLRTLVDGLVTIDEHGQIVLVNDAAVRMFGYSQEQFLGKHVSMLMPSPHAEQHDAYVARYIQTGVAQIIGIGREVTARRRDGSEFPTHLSISEARVHGRRLFTGIVRDLSAQKKVEADLHRERDFSDNIIRTAQAIILVLDAAGRIVEFNPYFHQLAGYALHEVKGVDWFEKFVPGHQRDNLRLLCRSVLDGHNPGPNVCPLVTRDGRTREVTWAARRMLDDEGRIVGVLAVGQDVTEFREAERRMRQQERLAGIGQMTAGLAHESRNALQRARACLDMLELDLANQPELLDLVRRARRAFEELHRLYEEIRNYSAPVHLDWHDCRMEELLSDCWDELAPLRSGRSIEFQVECSSSAAVCRCDPGRLQQVFRNILENAIAACPEPGGRIEVHCSLERVNGESVQRLRFLDNGHGLKPEAAERIFEPFFTTKSAGTGLGMAIARRLIDAHGGDIQVGPPSPQGAEIIVTLPRRHPPETLTATVEHSRDRRLKPRA